MAYHSLWKYFILFDSFWRVQSTNPNSSFKLPRDLSLLYERTFFALFVSEFLLSETVFPLPVGIILGLPVEEEPVIGEALGFRVGVNEEDNVEIIVGMYDHIFGTRDGVNVGDTVGTKIWVGMTLGLGWISGFDDVFEDASTEGLFEE